MAFAAEPFFPRNFLGKRVAALLSGLVLVVLMPACGFAPRGSISEITDPGAIFVDATRGVSLGSELRDALEERELTLAADRDAAEILLQLSDERQNERIVSVQSEGRVSELELSHSVSMLLARRDPEATVPFDQSRDANRVEVIREYTYDERGVLGKEDEARILREEMRQELIRQVVLRAAAGLAGSAAPAATAQ